MNNTIKRDFSNFSILLKILIVFALVVGIFGRFSSLDSKALSNDETFSSTYIYGHSLAEIIDDDIVTVKKLQDYQQLNPQESLTTSIQRLVEHPYVFPPLYGILMQFWARLWSNFTDNFVVISRSLSVFISLFSLLGMYLLCRELSESTTMAWIGVAFVAISPFHLQYSQIIRTYSLTTAATLLSSALLLRAIRINQKSNWIVYSLSVAGGLYANLLFGFVGVGHLAYVLLSEKFRLTKTFRAYFLAAAVGSALFLPWFILFISAPNLLGYSVAQVADSKSLKFLLSSWLKNLRPIFIDINNPWVEFTNVFARLQNLLTPLFLLLLLAAIYYLVRYGNEKVRNLSLCLIGFSGILLMVKDLTTGGTFSTRLRYILPYVIGIELVVTYFLASILTSKHNWQRKLSEITISCLLVLGIISCGIISNADSWWAFGAPDYPAIAREINKNSNPVVIFEDWGDALTMSYLLDPEVNVHLTRKGDFYLQPAQRKIYDKFSDILVFKPNQKIQNKIENNSSLTTELLSISDSFVLHQPEVWRINLNR
jgi:uncharacterized membrane protein